MEALSCIYLAWIEFMSTSPLATTSNKYTLDVYKNKSFHPLTMFTKEIGKYRTNTIIM